MARSAKAQNENTKPADDVIDLEAEAPENPAPPAAQGPSIGAVVRLASGGVPMTLLGADQAGKAIVTWMDSAGGMHEAHLPPQALVLGK